MIKKPKELILIVAMAHNRVIGKGGKIPWRLSEDSIRFKHLTLNYPVIMGRKTYEDILDTLGKPLPKRTNIVISTTLDERIEDSLIVCDCFRKALTFAKKDNSERGFVIGGQEVYKEAIKIADRLEITRVIGNYDGDRFFPFIDPIHWRLTEVVDRRPTHRFSTYKRRIDSSQK